MSSRIMIDGAGPGDRPNPAPEPTEPQRTPPEPQERDERVSATPVAEEREEAHERPADDASQPSEHQPSESERDYQRRIDQLTRDKYAAQRERDQMRAEFQRWQEQQRPAPQLGQRSQQEYDRDVAQGIANRAFDQACNTLYSKGREEYGQGMDEAVAALTAIGYGDVQQNPAAYLALNELAEYPDGHRLYRELAGDLDNAARILRLPPNMIIREIARMDARIRGAQNTTGNEPVPNREPAGVEVSRAPEPVRHIGGRSTQAERPLDDPRTTMAEFIRRRDRDERRSRISR